MTSITTKIENGELDEMNEFQFMVFMQKMTRSMSTNREIPIQVKSENVEKLYEYLNLRLEKDENPIYLHEIGDWLSLTFNWRRRS